MLILFTTAFLMFVSIIAIFLLPFLVTRIPEDYFVNPKKRKRPQKWPSSYSVVNVLLIILKNILGLLCLILGIVMLLFPGQGLLTILLALILLDFPRKYVVERWFVRRPRILRVVNWLRVRSGHPPLRF